LKPLHDYTDWLASRTNETAYGTAVAKTVEGGLDMLEKHLPIELATRSMALYNKKNGKTCASYLEQIPSVGGGAEATCGPYNFTNVEHLMLFVNGTWYPGYENQIMHAMDIN